MRTALAHDRQRCIAHAAPAPARPAVPPAARIIVRSHKSSRLGEVRLQTPDNGLLNNGVSTYWLATGAAVCLSLWRMLEWMENARWIVLKASVMWAI